MLSSFFATVGYRGPGKPGWPRPPRIYDREIGLQSFRESVEELEYADELGFDWVSISEHHYGFSMCAIPTVYGMHMANHLKRAKVAVLGPTIPLNNPIRVAEELALLDNLAEGRLVVGLLRGTPNEYQVYSANPVETREVTQEGIELILKAWTEPEPFGWDGKHFRYRMVSVWPRPLQNPFPPTFALGNSAETCDFAARHHLGIGVSFGTFQGNGRSTGYYRERCEAYGWQPAPEQILYRARIVIGESEKEVATSASTITTGTGAAENYLRYGAGVVEAVKALDPNPFHTGGGPMPGREEYRPPENGMGPTFVGTPEQIIEQVKECKEVIGAGVIDLMFNAQMGSEGLKRHMKLFAEEVMPKIKDL